MRSLLLLTLAISLIVGPAIQATQDTATISGTIRHNGQPVAGVTVVINASGHVRETITGADGAYNIDEIPTGTWVFIHLIPPVEQRLVFRNWRIDPLDGDLIKDFDLQSGHLLRAKIEQPDGSPYPENFWLGVEPVDDSLELPPTEWLGNTVFDSRFEIVLPPGQYLLFGDAPPYAVPPIEVTLKEDITDLVITLNGEEAPSGQETEPGTPYIPTTTPPRADRITVSEPDTAGYATITGTPGAVLPGAGVFIVNLNAQTFATADADGDGAFTAEMFAPPGSALLIKHTSNHEWIKWFLEEARHEVPGGDHLNELPGTVIQVTGDTDARGDTRIPFQSAGAWIGEEGSKDWAGWWFEGIINAPGGGPNGLLAAQPGQQATISGTLRGTSPNWTCGNKMNFRPTAHLHLKYTFDAGGHAHPWGNWFNTFLSTPTGLPLEHEAEGEFAPVGSFSIDTPVCTGAHTFEAPLEMVFDIPPDLPVGTYKLQAHMEPRGVPLSENSNRVVIWYAFDPLFHAPPVMVGQAAMPDIPWVLLSNYPVNGYRGVTANEDAGYYDLTTRVITPPHQTIIPRVDARSGDPIAYRLEPGSIWISSTERRQPNPPHLPLVPSGELSVAVTKPDGSTETLGPAPIVQSYAQTPDTPGGAPLDHGTGHIGDMYHLHTMDDAFAYTFDQYGPHTISISGKVNDVYSITYPIQSTYDVYVAEVLDLDPAQLPTTPYVQGDSFAPGLHLFPPVPAEVTVQVTHMPNSNPDQAITQTFTGTANRFGIFQPAPGEAFTFDQPGEFRIDITAEYQAPDGTLWMGAMTWGNVVEGANARIEAHGRRGMDYEQGPIDDMPAWFEAEQLPPEKVGIEMYYPYFSGDIHWGNEEPDRMGDSIHSIITIKDLTPDQMFYDILRRHFPKTRTGFRWPPVSFEDPQSGLEQRIAVGEAPLFITTASDTDAAVNPGDIDFWGYWYGSSERPDVRVREVISEDNMGTAYWRFDDTYGYQIGEGAAGDLPGDIKWEFGGAVFRLPAQNIAEYAVYSSLWVLLPYGDPAGARVTPPFQDATGASINGGPIMTLKGEEIDMLFLPKSVRPGDILEVGGTVSFSGHVGPPLNSQVTVTITAPSGATFERVFRANKIGWVYDPAFDFVAEEAGRWTVKVSVLHDMPYVGNGVIPMSHNTGTVLGTEGYYEFYVVPANTPRLEIVSPESGFLPWPYPGKFDQPGRIKPITIEGSAPSGTTTVYYTIHDKGVVIEQGEIVPEDDGSFSLVYDAKEINKTFPFVSLTAHEGMWEGLADEVAINFLAVGGETPQANTVTLIGEEVFTGGR